MSTLATLVAILDKGSFAAAAETVGCTPSAVSLQMKQLESYFGQPLFDRSARTATPTPFAHEAGAVARESIARLRELRSRRTVTVSGRVRLGAIASIQMDALPQALRLLRDRHPALDVEVTVEDSDRLVIELRAGRVDAAAMVRPQAGGSSRFLWQNLTKQPFVLLVPATAHGSAIDLLHSAWIRYDLALTGGRIASRYVRSVAPRAQSVMDVRSIDAIVAMVSAGLGASVVPQPRSEILKAHAVRALPLGRRAPTRQIAMARRKPDADSRNLDAIRQALVTVYASREPH